MFEQGLELKRRHGADQVFDFSLGNPVLEPPQEVSEELRRLVERPAAGRHRYMPNAGHPEVRRRVAEYLAADTGADLQADDIFMTCGAGGGLNIVLKALLDPGDEVVVVAPFFPEYRFYAENHGGRLVVAESDEDFNLDSGRLETVLTPRTRVLIINSPNNPTGRLYDQRQLQQLGELLLRHGRRHDRVVTLISDEPYRKIIFDGLSQPSVFSAYPHSVLVNSHSKDLGLAGERIGYVAVGPEHADRLKLRDALAFTNRILGFVNAPALFQWVAAACQEASVPVEHYQQLRDLFCAGLDEAGIEYVRPQGAFYIFPRTPGPPDREMEFVQALLRERVLVVPGAGFGRPGHFRISFCVTRREIAGALPAFRRVTGSG